MSVVVKSKNGKKVTLFNPNEKATKFAREMKTGLKFTILKLENKKCSQGTTLETPSITKR